MKPFTPAATEWIGDPPRVLERRKRPSSCFGDLLGKLGTDHRPTRPLIAEHREWIDQVEHALAE